MRPESLSLWDEDDAVVPRRSRLYHLQIQRASADLPQESLLSYLHRVAVSHTVPVLRLLQMEVVSLTDMRSARFSSGFAKRYSKTVNGYGKYAEQMSASLEQLTMAGSLRSGTCLHWRGLFDPKGTGLLATAPRWCPNCIDTQQVDGDLIVVPLLWSLASVTRCLHHGVPLLSTCPACGAEQHFISDASPRGRCSSCGGRLGFREGLWANGKATPHELFMGEAVSEMLSLGRDGEALASLEIFSSQINAFAAAKTGRGIRHLEREIGFRKHSICRWTEEGKRPQFDQFLELCFRIGTKPVALLDGSWAQVGSAVALRKDDVPVRRRSHILTESAIAALKADVERIVTAEDSFEDAVAVADRHGISVSAFKYRYGDLYATLAQHRVAVRARLKQQRLVRHEAAAIDLVRLLYRNGVRLTRARIEAAMLEAGMTLKDPVTRRIAFKERERLESQAAVKPGRSAKRLSSEMPKA